MSQQNIDFSEPGIAVAEQPAPKKKRRISLATYISLLLALVAVVPLFATYLSIELLLRPALINQVSADMARDAQTRIQLIDTYLAERLNDIKTLSQSAPITSLLTGNQASKDAASNVIFVAQHRDIANYISISLIDLHGGVVLSYPSSPLLHGKNLITPEASLSLQKSGNVFISNVFYDLTANKASVDLYARVINDKFQLLGYVRVSLGLHRIWEAADSEPLINGANSYAFMLDENGVRIAYTNPDPSGFTHSSYLFKAVTALSPQLQERIQSEDLYGNSSTTVTTTQDSTLAAMQGNTPSQSIFQFTPAGSDQSFEAATYTSTVVPWTYFILKPFSTVTGIADQQILTIILIVSLILVLAVLVGLFTGRRIAVPILRSVSSLRKNSESLKILANEEHTVASEQSWMVEASQVALASIKYYTNAANVAALRIHTLGTEISHNKHDFDQQKFNQAIQEMVEAATYIERAIKHQEGMNEKLQTALRITTQATEQLTRGSKSTDDAATQLETIVGELTSVVGE